MPLFLQASIELLVGGERGRGRNVLHRCDKLEGGTALQVLADRSCVFEAVK